MTRSFTFPEALLVQDSRIAAAVVFGSGRAQVGVLVQPKEPFDTSDPVKVRSFRDSIWCATFPLCICGAVIEPLPLNLQADCRACQRVLAYSFMYIQGGTRSKSGILRTRTQHLAAR